MWQLFTNINFRNMYYLDFKIKKKEYLRINKIIELLARLSDLEEIQELNYLWSNMSNRNMFGYELDESRFKLRKLVEYSKNKSDCKV